MARRCLLTVLGMAALLALAACGKDDDEPAPAAAPPPVPTTTVAAPPPVEHLQGGGPPPGKGPAAAARRREQRPSEASGAADIDASSEPDRVVERSLGQNIRPGQPTVISSACSDGNCAVRYRSGPRGGGVVLAEQAPILRRMFADGDTQSVRLYVHHQSVGTPHKNERPAFATTSCRRSDHPDFDWARISADDIPLRCRSTHVPGGRQRSLIKRGLITEEEAAQGAGGKPQRGGGRNR